MGSDSSNLALVAERLAAARQGSVQALGQLLKGCQQYLLLIANQELTPDLHAKVSPSDLVQETFIQAVEGFENFRGESEPELLAWLRQILLNQMTNAVRRFRGTQRRQVQREVALDSYQAGEPSDAALHDPQPSPRSQAIAGELNRDLKAAMQMLPENYRQVIEMRHQQGLSFAEIGQVLGKSAEAARMLWARAVSRLTSELDQLHEGSGPANG